MINVPIRITVLNKIKSFIHDQIKDSRAAPLTVCNTVSHLQVWLEEDVELYDFAKVRPLIKKKQVKVMSLFPVWATEFRVGAATLVDMTTSVAESAAENS